jgi:nicotinate-nucleotide adenylyltransferase
MCFRALGLTGAGSLRGLLRLAMAVLSNRELEAASAPPQKLRINGDVTRQQSRSIGSIRVRAPLATAGQRVGIMGGTFNPPHDGHRIVAETAVKRLGLDQLWWVVTPGNPLKANGALPSQAARMALCKPFALGPKMKITGFETELGTPYTAATLSFLKIRHPEVRFVWVMGADNLAGFDHWQQWRQITHMMPIAVIDRPGWRHQALAGKAAQVLARNRIDEADALTLADLKAPAWVFLTSRLSSLSSTALRQNELTRSTSRPVIHLI